MAPGLTCEHALSVPMAAPLASYPPRGRPCRNFIRPRRDFTGGSASYANNPHGHRTRPPRPDIPLQSELPRSTLNADLNKKGWRCDLVGAPSVALLASRFAVLYPLHSALSSALIVLYLVLYLMLYPRGLGKCIKCACVLKKQPRTRIVSLCELAHCAFSIFF